MFFGDLQTEEGWSAAQLQYLNTLIDRHLAQDTHESFF
jgi:hypothetical protein